MSVERPPPKMKLAELDARAGGFLKLLHDRPAGPAIREPAGNHKGDGQPGDERECDDEAQPVFQAEFSLRFIHCSKFRLRVTACRRQFRFRSSTAILYRPATLPSGC